MVENAISRLSLRYDAVARPLFLPLAFAVFTASGFAGLIYQSIWSHYLKLMLGHAAYAQTLVLAIFMGGMALGAWFASSVSLRWRRLLLAYAIVEVLIGLASLAFNKVFLAASAYAFDDVIPGLGSPGLVHAFKWSLAGALVLPQSILLGMTFPFMTGGVLRAHPQRSGYVVAMLYFTNSLGAAAGVLASGFYFIATVGLPGTLVAAGIVNLCVAAAVLLLPGAGAAPQPLPPASAGGRPADGRLLLAVAALTGLSSFMYEIGWIRMLSLVLGSSTHAFELMLSAFILGIAFGGLWVRRRIDAAGDTVRLLGWVQVAMGIAALVTLPVYGASFVWMQTALAALSPSDSGYIAFNLVSHAICLAVMFPAAFFAGMTLPLITASLLRKGAGERAIGQVYAANTAGAIAGVVLAVHLGLPLLGLKNLIVFAAAIDMALGLILLRGTALPRVRRLDFGAAGALSLAAVGVALLAVKLNAHEMASGVFRLGHLLQDPQQVHLQIDGKTSTVSVTQSGSVLALRVNGKPDGALSVEGEPAADEITMTLFGALPQLIAPQARQMAVIGFGTGITTHVLLASRSLERLDTIEIEPAVTQAAERHFLQFNQRAFQDPRSRIHYEDAKTYFSSSALRYDAIASEPSNPWVSGVASLFTTEFYRDARRYLTEGGLFYQWVQLYEISPQLFATVIAALEENFSDYELWMTNPGDLIIVAANGGQVPRVDARAFDNPTLRKELERFRINNVDDLYLHRVGDRRSLGPYFASLGAQANSDFVPVLDQNAARARFLRANVTDFASLQQAPLRLVELFDGQAERHPRTARLTPGERPWLPVAALVHQAAAVSEYMRAGRPDLLRKLPTALAPKLVTLRMALVECRAGLPSGSLRGPLADLARYVTAHLPAQESVALWSVLAQSPCRGIAESDQRWLRLHAAVAAGTPSSMKEAADLVLRHEQDVEPRLLAYAVASYMAGAILERDAGAGMRTYARHRQRMGKLGEWEPMFRFLLAHAQAPRAPK